MNNNKKWNVLDLVRRFAPMRRRMKKDAVDQWIICLQQQQQTSTTYIRSSPAPPHPTGSRSKWRWTVGASLLELRQHAAGYNNQPNVADADDDDDEYNHLIVIYQNQIEGIFCQPCSLINTMRWQLSRGEERTKRKVTKWSKKYYQYVFLHYWQKRFAQKRTLFETR